MEACREQAEAIQDALNCGRDTLDVAPKFDSIARACSVSASLIGHVSQLLETPHHKTLLQLLGTHILECGSLRDRCDFFSMFGLSLSGSSMRQFCSFCVSVSAVTIRGAFVIALSSPRLVPGAVDPP